MRVFDSLDAVTGDAFERGSAVAVGKFDGLHLGHQALLHRVFEASKARGLESVVFTFSNSPLSLLRPELCPPAIMSRAQQLEGLAVEGLESCVMVPFDTEFAAISAEAFIEEVLVRRLRTKHVCLGADFRFGSGGKGDAALLAEAGARLGFTVEVVEDVGDAGSGRVSSSRLREAIQSGDVVAANRMKGRPVAIRGEVVHGDARGRDLGFPTANLGGEIEGLRPADGVYAGWVLARGQLHQAAISVGANLTFEPEGEPRVEAFLIDFSGDLYGETIEVRFAQRLRGMVAFSGVDALVERMHEDVREVREILNAG